MKKPIRNNSGFTLIELLVVISIIALLSSIVIASLNSARLKARDAAIIAGVGEMRKLLELEFNDTGSYINFFSSGGWINSKTGCDNSFSGTYQTQARKICANIVNNSSGDEPWGYGDIRFYIGNSIDNNKYYSILAYLPGKNKFYCAGSSGGNSEVTLENGVSSWSSPGCYNQP